MVDVLPASRRTTSVHLVPSLITKYASIENFESIYRTVMTLQLPRVYSVSKKNTLTTGTYYKRQISIHSTHLFKNYASISPCAIPLIGILIIIKLSNLGRKTD